MGNSLKIDIDRFFSVFESRTEDTMRQLPPALKAELEEEIDLLRQSIQNRIVEYTRRG